MSNIEWTDVTWNPVVGCSKVSAGCKHCYASRMARRLGTMPHAAPVYQGLTTAHGDWTGVVRMLPGRVWEPLGWRKPRRVFVCSMSDLFHDDVTAQFASHVWATMAACPQHTFQVLTKRPQTMARWLAAGAEELVRAFVRVKQCRGQLPDTGKPLTWPLPNVWLGTSCEDQRAADARIPHLLSCPAAVRFLSCEPLLESVDVQQWLYSDYDKAAMDSQMLRREYDRRKVDWVIVGGESGAGARRCSVEWIASVVQQCEEASTACFVKQLGARPSWPVDGPPVRLKNRKGNDPAEWPEYLQVREFPRPADDAGRTNEEGDEDE